MVDELIIHDLLLGRYGDQFWWPADDAFEVMIGAILTQNTAWTNVEKAITNLKAHDMCNSGTLLKVDQPTLAALIRPSGYFNQKAQRLLIFARWYRQQGGYAALNELDTAALRESLLALKGIGNETADDILLYAFHRPVFVIDTYTRRLFCRLGMCTGKESYANLQQMFHQHLSPDVDLFKQYHALIVAHAKHHCRKIPLCKACPLALHCEYEHEKK